MTHNRLKGWYAFLITTALPLLSIYGFQSIGLTFSAIYMILVMIALFLFGKKTYHPDSVYFPILIYIIFQSIFAVAVYKDVGMSLFFSVMQYVCYLVLLYLFNRDYFDQEKFLHYINITAVITSLYIVFQQMVASLTGRYLGAGLPFLPLMNEGYQTYTSLAYSLGVSAYRPRSLFSEPAMYATFTVLALAVNLLYARQDTQKMRRMSAFRSVLYTAGIIVSRSTLGIIAMVFAWGVILLYKMQKQHGRLTFKWMLVICILPVVVFLIMQTSFVQFQINRLFRGNLVNEQRFQVFLNMENLDLTTWYKVVFGHDYNLTNYNSNVFLPSILRHLYAFGGMGVFILMLMFIRLFFRSTTEQRILFLLFIVIIAGSEVLHGQAIVWYFAWLKPAKRIKQVSKDSEETHESSDCYR